MNTTPENIPDETLIQAKVVHAQLLIKTNTLNIVHQIFHIHRVSIMYGLPFPHKSKSSSAYDKKGDARTDVVANYL